MGLSACGAANASNAALPKLLQDFLSKYSVFIQIVQCFDAVGRMAERASGL